jgi:superfamily II DNA or RNA helicase
MANSDLYIVDNSITEMTVSKYLNEWCDISSQMDIATGYFEIGGLLDMDGNWQKLDKIRVLFGDEMTRRTKDVITTALQSIFTKLDESIETEKEKNEFLFGVAAIVEALSNGKIECKAYNKDKFHAKTYITYFKDDYHNSFSQVLNIPKGYALVGSSNFTKAGLTNNVELNVQVTNDIEKLQEWYNLHWEEAEDITDDILKVIEKQAREYMPYDIYLKSMYEFFKGREESISEWEQNSSVVYPNLARYQIEGYYNLIKIASRYRGAFLCDGVGLGKTFVGLMLIERMVKKERKKVVLIVPAAARYAVWEATIRKYVPELLGGWSGLKIINHTDLTRESQSEVMDDIAQNADCIVIDEAHHFRNRASGRYRKLFDMIGMGCEKQMFMLTATPINNSFLDLQHMIELFTQRVDDYFKQAPLGIHSLKGHFKKMETQLSKATDCQTTDTSVAAIESEKIFRNNDLVERLVIQRSRAFVRKSLDATESATVLFPTRQAPNVAKYSLKKCYGGLIKHFVDTFDRKDKTTGNPKPILNLAVYSPYDKPYFIGDESKIDDMKQGRQMQVVNLIRQLLLKRFESSPKAFEETCARIYMRLMKFLLDYKHLGNERTIDKSLLRHEPITTRAKEVFTWEGTRDIEEAEDDLPDYVWEVEDNLAETDFDIKIMLDDTLDDIESLAKFIDDLMGISPDKDDKLRELTNILATDERIKGKKVIVFTEYRSTARYIFKELAKAGIKDIFEMDGQTKIDRRDVIERFAPYYNDKTSSTIKDEIRILISTDVLAEGLNLQDAACLINYELHWNPVRLMQRIGRVDRRRNATIEEQLLKEHSELKADRENVYIWNFLPPDELDEMLLLHQKVSRKTLRISKTFGIEGKKLLTPEDDYDALKDFNNAYEGTESNDEEMQLAYQKLMQDNPEYLNTVTELPKKMFSGKLKSDLKGIFFCYRLPVKNLEGEWDDENNECAWYLLDTETNSILESTHRIWREIITEGNEPRIMSVTAEEFAERRKEIERHIKNTYLQKIQAPAHIKAKLLTWMELY